MIPELLTPKEAAVFLHISEAQLKGYRMEGTGPRYVRINARVIRYRMRDLLAWINDRVEEVE
ncbi:MAG: helix-turn-helix domain-containing protein [Planctomycetota bacterium]